MLCAADLPGRSARSSPAGIGYRLLRRRGRAEFWGKSILVLPQHDPLEAAAPRAVLGRHAAAGRRPPRHRHRLCLLYLPARPAGACRARGFRPLYLFLLNKWYFDELYDCLFVRPAFALGRGLWKQGDGAMIDGLGPGRHRRRRRVRLAVARQPPADRLCLPLRLRDADRRRHLRLLVPLPGSGERRNHGPTGRILSLVTFLPLARRRAHHDPARRRRTTVARNARWIALWTSLVDLRPVARHLGAFRPDDARISSSSSSANGCRHSTSPITWGSTASRCSSCCSRPS